MIGSLKLVTHPSADILTLAEAKAHLRIETSVEDEDAYLTALITSARRHLEETLGRALLTQTWEYALDGFPAARLIKIPRAPLISVTHLKYYDEDLSTVSTFSSASYQVDTQKTPGIVALKSGESWPTAALRESSGVIVTFVAGYGTEPADVPEPIRHAAKLLVAQMYEHREPEVTGTIVSPVRFAVDALTSPFRVSWF